jgi:hypothetical protein
MIFLPSTGNIAAGPREVWFDELSGGPAGDWGATNHIVSDTKPRAQRLSRRDSDPLAHASERCHIQVVATGSLIVWALDEVVRGNPWRRFLGVAVLIYEVSTVRL